MNDMVKEYPPMRNVRKAKEGIALMHEEGLKLPVMKPCKCGDFPRVKTNGGSYVHLLCHTCGYESGPYLSSTLEDVIKRWNESDRDRERQKAGVAAFDQMMDYCNNAKGTKLEDKPIPQGFFSFLKGKNHN